MNIIIIYAPQGPLRGLVTERVTTEDEDRPEWRGTDQPKKRDMIAVNLSFSFRTPSISWLKRSGCKVSVTRREAAEIDGGRKV